MFRDSLLGHCSLQLLTSYCLYYCTFELVLKFLGFFLLHVRKFKGTGVYYRKQLHFLGIGFEG